ncbi:MAG: YaeQ family protein [Sedimenticolaceae bacterium]
MALNATIHRCTLQVSDLDRGYYQTHALTLARHPSETDQRMMMRVLAFALNADEHLSFTRGLSQDDEPDLWQHSLSDELTLWIETGQPDEKRIKKACSRSERVLIYCYQHRAANVWWTQIARRLERFNHLSVFKLPEGIGERLAGLAQRTMDLQCTVQDGEIWLSSEAGVIQFALEQLR